MATATQALAIAAGELGYNRWDDPEAGTKYGRWYAAHTGHAWFGASGVAFCAMGVSWVLAQLGMTPPGGHFAYVPYGIANARAAGCLVPVTSAQPGDLVCFDWDEDGEADHVGFVEVNHGSYLQTIEFNTSGSWAGSQSNGGGVYRRTRDWDSVCAMIRPAYDGAWSSASSGAGIAEDGEWGRETNLALQRHFGTTQDGVVSSQEAYWQSRFLAAVGGWEWVSNPEGSQLIAAMQQALGIDADGIAGPAFINALEAHYGFEPDGFLDDPSNTVRAMQRALNQGRF